MNAVIERRAGVPPAPAERSSPPIRGILRHAPQDAWLVALALLHGAVLVVVPSVPLIAFALWWNANTISHNFIHLPFFRSRTANHAFSAYLSLLLGFPQSLWASRHLAHHRDEPFRWRPVRRAWCLEGALVLVLWAALLACAPRFFVTIYLPGWVLGLGLCQLQGHFEHARGTVSHHGWIYNWLFFNDGYHVEHHERPARHWTELPHATRPDAGRVSRWPAVLRWLEHAGLDGLEELVLHCASLRRFVLRAHERALARALAHIPTPGRVVIVGGALFPRTALALRRLVPTAQLVIVDVHSDRLDRARAWLDERVEFVHGFCTPENLAAVAGEADLVIVPLALRGAREPFYVSPPARHVLVHDWLWRRRGESVVISALLLKRLNLVRPERPLNRNLNRNRNRNLNRNLNPLPLRARRLGLGLRLRLGLRDSIRFMVPMRVQNWISRLSTHEAALTPSPSPIGWERVAGRPGEGSRTGSAAGTRALALFALLATAKACAVAGRPLPLSAWTPLALFWQDALVALGFAGVEWMLRRRPGIVRVLFWLLAAYAALNVPLTRVLSSPLTLPMTRAAGGALSDSIRHYLTPGILGLTALVLVAAAGFAAACRKLRPVWTRRGLGLLAALALAGMGAADRVDCAGMHRNALVAFVASALPRVPSRAPDAPCDWRAALPDGQTAEDLTAFRGAAAGRNVVLIALESTGARALRSYGAAEDPTPNLTRLASSALLFENACAVYPESIQGLFSVLCSRYPAFDTPAGKLARVQTPALAEVLAGAGYRTALFHSGRFMYLGMNAVIRDRGFETLEDAGAIGGNFNSSFGVDEPATVTRMLAWIDGLPRGQRFFLHYLPIAGHHPYETPVRGPFPDSTDAGQYLNALHFGDAALGQFLEGLRRRGLDTQTLFVFYGDHGEAFGQHDGNFGHTLFLYEENVRVPLFLAMPGAWREGRRVQKLASLIDVAPTVLNLLGLRAPADYDGVSLLEPRARAALFFTDYSMPLVGLRDGRWKLILEAGSSRAKLFDLEEDPGELRNVAGRFPERVEAWRRRLDAWASAQKALLQDPTTHRSRSVNDVVPTPGVSRRGRS